MLKLDIQTRPSLATGQDQVRRVLNRQQPARIVYAPNYWQWFAHHQHHGLLPPELAQTEFEVVMVELGIGFTVADTVPAADEQPPTVTDKLYVPLAAVVAPEIVGFCTLEVKPFGPDQL